MDSGRINYKCLLGRNRIQINGKEYTKDKQGFSIAVMDFKSGDVEKTITFDLYFNPHSSKEIEAFIKRQPRNKVICGVVKDEGYNRLTQGVKNAIVSVFFSIGFKREGLRLFSKHLLIYSFYTFNPKLLRHFAFVGSSKLTSRHSSLGS